MTWYGCSACGKSVNCKKRENPEEMKKIIAEDDCSDYDYQINLRFRGTFT